MPRLLERGRETPRTGPNPCGWGDGAVLTNVKPAHAFTATCETCISKKKPIVIGKNIA